MKYLLAGLFLLAMPACAQPGSPRRIDIEIKNKTTHKIKLRAASGFLSRDIELAPGQEWHGWADRIWIGPQAAIEIREE